MQINKANVLTKLTSNDNDKKIEVKYYIIFKLYFVGFFSLLLLLLNWITWLYLISIINSFWCCQGREVKLETSATKNKQNEHIQDFDSIRRGIIVISTSIAFILLLNLMPNLELLLFLFICYSFLWK